MSTKAKEASEGDAIVARALSSYAQLRASIASWSGLPAAAVANGEPPADEDEELFTAESETIGVGYVASPDGERSKLSTDKLRKQMLGRHTRPGMAELERVGSPKKLSVSRKGGPPLTKDNEESEEDTGRSSLGKKRKHTSVPTKESAGIEVRPSDVSGVGSGGDSHIAKPPSSYLDEVLAEREKKRKKKRNNTRDST